MEDNAVHVDCSSDRNITSNDNRCGFVWSIFYQLFHSITAGTILFFWFSNDGALGKLESVQMAGIVSLMVIAGISGFAVVCGLCAITGIRKQLMSTSYFMSSAIVVVLIFLLTIGYFIEIKDFNFMGLKLSVEVMNVVAYLASPSILDLNALYQARRYRDPVRTNQIRIKVQFVVCILWSMILFAQAMCRVHLYLPTHDHWGKFDIIPAWDMACMIGFNVEASFSFFAIITGAIALCVNNSCWGKTYSVLTILSMLGWIVPRVKVMNEKKEDRVFLAIVTYMVIAAFWMAFAAARKGWTFAGRKRKKEIEITKGRTRGADDMGRGMIEEMDGERANDTVTMVNDEIISMDGHEQDEPHI